MAWAHSGRWGQVLAALETKGFRAVTVQYGRGPRPECCAADDAAAAAAASSSGRSAPTPPPHSVRVDAFPFSPSLDAHMRAADLVVSHAGAGSVFEALSQSKRLLVVVNDALMDNHQVHTHTPTHTRPFHPTARWWLLRLRLAPSSARGLAGVSPRRVPAPYGATSRREAPPLTTLTAASVVSLPRAHLAAAGTMQAELACELESRRHCFVTSPAQLLATLEAMPPFSSASPLTPYAAGDPSAVAAAIDAALGVGVA